MPMCICLCLCVLVHICVYACVCVICIDDIYVRRSEISFWDLFSASTVWILRTDFGFSGLEAGTHRAISLGPSLWFSL